MSKDYIEKRKGGYWVKDSRISLDSIVYAFKAGASPETIKHKFPLLRLEEIYGAITFYLANEKKVDDYLEEANTQLESTAAARRKQIQKAKPELIKRLKSAKQESEVTR
ncbi:MAG: DUF433 domain-containing protein [Acidobacteriota bacterium]